MSGTQLHKLADAPRLKVPKRDKVCLLQDIVRPHFGNVSHQKIAESG